MARWGNCDYKQLQQLQKNLEKLQSVDMDKFYREAAKELAARLLALVIKVTPIGTYNGSTYVCAPGSIGREHKGQKITGKNGGTLRRGWTAKTHDEAESGSGVNVAAFAKSLPISKIGNTYVVEVINPVEYASYVEFGHRTVNGGWVKGHYFLTLCEEEINNNVKPALLERKLEKLLRDIYKV